MNFRFFFLCGLILSCGACAEFRGIFTEAPQSTRSTSSDSRRETIDWSDAQEGEAPKIRQPIVTDQGVYYFMKPGDTLETIAKRYHTDWESIADINRLFDTKIVMGRRLFIPNKKTVDKYVTVSRVINQDRSRAVNAKTLSFAWPIPGAKLSSPFGYRRGRPHSGVDLSAKVGTPIFAAEDGRVLYSKRFTSYGNLIVIKHAGGYFSAYAHNSSVFVNDGQNVKKGQKISLVGMTGRTYGAHLHFEIHKGEQAVDPMPFLTGKNK